MLNIGDSTLRKWCIALEKNAYKFIRNDQNQRLYVEHDLIALRHFQVLVQEHHFKIENAADVVISRFNGVAFQNETGIVLDETAASIPTETTPDTNQVINRLLAYIEEQDRTSKLLMERLEKQEQFNQKLLERLNRQHCLAEERMQERHTMLMEKVRTLQALKEEKKKGLLQRLLKG